MAQQPSSHKPVKLNLDVSKKYLPPDSSFYLLNANISHPDALGKTTPFPANEPLCDMEQPVGENYSPSSYYNSITNESYSWVYNTNGVHYIMRVNGDGICEVCYSNNEDGCLKLSAEPKHEIQQFRAKLKIEKNCANRDGKYLEWTDGLHEIGFMDVEASIATDFFTTDFFKKCQGDPCDFLRLRVPQPCGCLNAEFVPLPQDEISKTNHLVDVGVKFMYQWEYYDGRKSEWSDRSILYYQSSKGCFDSAEGFPRCLSMKVPLGNAMVDKIHIGFNKGGIDEAGNDVWYITETIEKYKGYTTSKQKWYEREFSDIITSGDYLESDCTFRYVFCNDKQCKAIDPVEISRVFNPIPRKVQGIIDIKDAEGFFNYEAGNCPLDKKESEKFTIETDCPTDGKECVTEYTNVTVRAIIHNSTHDRNQFIYTDEAGDAEDTEKPKVVKFGGLNPSLGGDKEDPIGYTQYFKGKVKNFIVYIEGTTHFGEMKQYHSEKFFANHSFHGVVTSMGKASVRNDWRRDVRNDNFFYQEHTFKVPKGTKGFIRMASHHAVGNEQGTSTFVIGVLDNINQYRGKSVSNYNSSEEELYFDTCDKDKVEIEKTFLIQDNAVDKITLKNNPASAYSGYIRDHDKKGIEGLVVNGLLNGFQNGSAVTDHNGFFHFYFDDGTDKDITLRILGEKSCGQFAILKETTMSGGRRTLTHSDVTITKSDNLSYQTNSRAKVKLVVQDCDGQAVGGVKVALSGTKTDTTNGKGEAEFFIRNYSSRARNVRAIVMDGAGCFLQDCDGNCNPCFPSITKATPVCYFTSAGELPASVDLGVVKLNRSSSIIGKVGLKSGGSYPFGFVVEGGGRISAVNTLPNITIEKTQKKGKVSFCGFKYDDKEMKLPDWAECLKIVRGVNQNPYELQWLVDKKEVTSDGKIKLTIQSLNDYNASYFFKTNTVYQWLKGDRIEFIKNGDGKIFSSDLNGVLNYNTLSPFFDKQQTEDPKKEQPADYFNQLLIEDDGRLATLQEGALIEIQRSKECVTEPAYFGICVSIPIVQVDNGDGTTHGRLLNPVGKFSTFDTYLVSRKVGNFPAQAFEHHSPSDFWGNRFDDTGKAYFRNQFENEKRFGRSITISSPTQFNYFGTLVKHFNAPDMGDITAMTVRDGKIIIGVCEFDNFLAQTTDEFARIGNDGILRALPADSIIGDIQPHLQGVYGCQYQDIGSVFFGDGYAMWVDSRKTCYVQHENYQQATNVSENKFRSYFEKRCVEKINNNKKEGDDFLNHYRFSTGIDRRTKNISVTIKRLRDSGINNQQAPYLQGNETFIYSPPEKEFLTFHSPTPEGYSELQLNDDVGCAMISFFQGIPYLTPINATKYNEFYGVSCDMYIGIAVNKFPEKIKVAVSAEVQSEQMWYIKKVETDKPEYKSEIPPARFKKTERKWNASFLGNINSREGLFGKEQARGYYFSLLFCRDNSLDLTYNSVDVRKQVEYGELDQIITKFFMSSQSGFDENL